MRIFTYRNIPIILHPSFIILAVGFVVVSGILHGPAIAAISGLLGALLFGSVLLHELGHALVAKHYNIDTHSIVLLPIGGMAMISKEPDEPRAEIYIALAGPAVNVVIFLPCAVAAYLGIPLAYELAVLNLAMGIFNLLPAFPMDGGRVLRACLSLKYGRVEATYRSLKVSTVFAWIFIVLGLFWGLIGVTLVGIFLIYMTSQHRQQLDDMTSHNSHRPNRRE